MLKKIAFFLRGIFTPVYGVLKRVTAFILAFLRGLIFDDKPDGGIWDTIKNVLIALVLALIIRSLLYEPFHIPSGSMKPNLKEGDFIFVSKYDYGYSRYSFPFGLPIFKNRIFAKNKPVRGDVLVFRLPSDPKINYIKRLIGLPGDKIQMKNGILFVNNVEIPKEYIGETLEFDDDPLSGVKEYMETLDNTRKIKVLDKFEDGVGDNTAVFVVPEKHYFFLGDNRDNSLDSRFKETGFIPEENLVGKARVIFFSSSENPLKFWKWGKIIRGKRIFKTIE